MDFTTLFNAHSASIFAGVIGSALFASLAIIANRMRGHTTIEQNAAYIETLGRVREQASRAFDKSPKLKSIMLEGNDYVYIFLRDQKMAQFDLRNKKNVQAWWQAQCYLTEPEKIYQQAAGECKDELKKGSLAYRHWKAIAKRNRTWIHPNFITKAGKEVDVAMISQLSGLINNRDEDSSSGMCHLALKVLDKKGDQHILIKPTMGSEQQALADMLDFDEEKRVLNLSPKRLLEWVELHHKVNGNKTSSLRKVVVPKEPAL